MNANATQIFGILYVTRVYMWICGRFNFQVGPRLSIVSITIDYFVEAYLRVGKIQVGRKRGYMVHVVQD